MTTVLIVDDSPIDRRLAAGLLGHAGDLRIETAADGGQALIMVMEEPPDLIVTDLQMAEINGLELVAAIRRRFSQIPVVLMTSQGSEEIAIEALRVGAASYVPKRILSTELLPTVRRVLSQAVEDRSQADLMNRLQSRYDEFVLGNELEQLVAMSRYLQQQIGAAWRLDKSECLRLGTATEEALLNAYYHGNLEIASVLKDEDYARFYELAEIRREAEPYRHRQIRVEFKLTPAQASISIRDSGPGFDPATLPDPSQTENLDRPYGRGVMLMRSFMDDVQFNDTGNEVTLIKRRFPAEE